MDGISKLAWRMSLAGVATAALAALAGCNESPPPAPPPPPAAAYQPAPPPPALLGAPPERQFIAMAPIPNPPEHGYGAHHGRHGHGDHSPGWWLRAHGYKAVATAPVQTAASAPAPKVVAPPKPAAAPVIAQAPSPLAQLAAAVADKSKGAMLSAPADLSAKKPGAVTLSLPADLFAMIKQEAAKLGLGKAAKKTEVTATLHGDGYTVTPPGPLTAPLVAGKPTTFTWQVAPGPNAKGPLTADVNAVLKGAGDAQTFTLAKLSQAVAAVDAAVKAAEASHGFKFPSLDFLSVPGHKDLTLPVVGKTPSKSIVGAAIVLAVLFLLALIARAGAGRREAAERRRYRTPTSATPAVGLAEAAEPHVEHVLAPAVEHAHTVEAAVAGDPAVDAATHEPPARQYEGPDLAAAHYEEPHTAPDEHAEAPPHDSHAMAAEPTAEQHIEEHHAEAPADSHAVGEADAADHAAADHAAHAEPMAHAAEDHPPADHLAPADDHAVAEPLVDHHGEAPVGDYVPIGDHGDAHHEVVHVVDDHADAHAAEANAGGHVAAGHAEDGQVADHHAADDHPVQNEHRHLELESI